MQREDNLLTVHVNMILSVNQNASWGYDKPQVDARFDFNIPVALFDSKPLAALLVEKVKELDKAFPAAVTAYEKEQAEEEAKTKAESEEKIDEVDVERSR